MKIEKSDWVAKKLHAEKIVCEKLEVSRIKSVVSRIKTKKTRVDKCNSALGTQGSNVSSPAQPSITNPILKCSRKCQKVISEFCSNTPKKFKMSVANWFKNAEECKARGDLGARRKNPRVVEDEGVTLEENMSQDGALVENVPNVSQNEVVAVNPQDIPLPSESESSDGESQVASVKDLDPIESIILKVESLTVNPKKRGRPVIGESPDLSSKCEDLNEVCKKSHENSERRSQ